MQVLVQAEDEAMYQVHTPHFAVPALVPLLQYTYKVRAARLLHPEQHQKERTVLYTANKYRQSTLQHPQACVVLSA
jgi:hypothetical protein